MTGIADQYSQHNNYLHDNSQDEEIPNQI